MQLTNLYLQQFRNYETLHLKLGKLVVIVGPNGSGKSNVLEAISLLARGKGETKERLEEMIRFEQPLAYVAGKIVRGGQEMSLKVRLTRGEFQGKRVARRTMWVNEVARQVKLATHQLVTVEFAPKDMRLLEGSPQRRREFVNDILQPLDRGYDRSLRRYEQLLVRRNALLQAVREGEQPRTVLTFYTAALIEEAEILRSKRERLLVELGESRFEGSDYELVYQPSVVTMQYVEEHLNREIAAGHTLRGPHKDEWRLRLKVEGVLRDAGMYGSRGQQRMAVVWLKLAQLQYTKKVLEETPVLLLDDVFSELDEEHEALVLKMVSSQQTIMAMTKRNEAVKALGGQVVRLEE